MGFQFKVNQFPVLLFVAKQLPQNFSRTPHFRRKFKIKTLFKTSQLGFAGSILGKNHKHLLPNATKWWFFMVMNPIIESGPKNHLKNKSKLCMTTGGNTTPLSNQITSNSDSWDRIAISHVRGTCTIPILQGILMAVVFLRFACSAKGLLKPSPSSSSSWWFQTI